jgi:Tol biopolymer transport system component
MLRVLPFAAAAVVTLGIGGAFGGLPASSQTPSTTPSPSPLASPSITPVPTWIPLESPPPTELFPVETPAPIAWTPPAWYGGSLKSGNWVRITGTDSCLNVRVSPGLFQQQKDGAVDMPVLNCLPDGFVGQLSFGPNNDWSQGQELPIQADGYAWWNVLGQGWVADEWLAFVQEGSAPFPARPELSGAGQIVFSRSDGLWLASADGTTLRLIYSNENNKGVGAARWSPDGQQIAVGVNRWDKDGANNNSSVVVIDLDGVVVSEYVGILDPNWSPDGGSLSALRVDAAGSQTPVVLDMTTGIETTVGSNGYYPRSPEWAPDGSAVSFVCWSNSWQEYLPDGTIVEHVSNCGGDGVQIVSLVDGSTRVLLPVDTEGTIRYDSPTWSPDGTLIVVYETGGECQGYALIDVASGTLSSCLPLPQVASYGYSCGGSVESGASDWSPDGQTLAYHWQFRAGQNGVALVNVNTGERKMILSTVASSISFSGDGAHLAFESSGYIWTADSDASDVQRMTDGWAPAWQPQP